MHIKFKIPTWRNVLLYFILVYILNKQLFDWVLGGIGKAFYYVVLFICAILGIFQYFSKKDNCGIGLLCFVQYIIVVLLNGMVFSNSEQIYIGYTQYIIYMLPFFAFLYLMKGKKDFEPIFKFISWWGTGIACLAIYEYIVKSPILPTSSGKIYTYFDGSSSFRATVFLGSPMTLAVALAMVFLLVVYRFFNEKKKIFLLMMCCILAGIFSTGSRGPLVMVLISSILLYYYYNKIGLISKKDWIILIITVVALLIFVMLIILNKNFMTGIESIDVIISRFSSTFNFSGEWGNQERIKRWTYYIKQFFERPFAGIGIAHTSGEVASNAFVTRHGVTTESGVLARLVETGLIGAVPYYIFLIKVLKKAYRKLTNKNNSNKNVSLIMSLSVVILILLEDIILQVSLNIFCTFILWFYVAYAYSIRNE